MNLKHKFNEQNGVCCYCHHEMTLDFNMMSSATRDHVVPKSKGGKGNRHNIVCACLRCNQIKGSKNISQFLLEDRPHNFPPPQRVPFKKHLLYSTSVQRAA